MTFATQLLADLNNVFFNSDEFAVEVSYAASGQTAATIKALIDYGATDPMQGMDALNTDAMMDIMVADIDTVTAGDSVVIGTGTWKVIFAKVVDDGLIWRCQISRINR